MRFVPVAGPVAPLVGPLALEDAQRLVGGYVEAARSETSPSVLLVNEEGWLARLPVNPRASAVAGFPVAGDAVVFDDEADYEKNFV